MSFMIAAGVLLLGMFIIAYTRPGRHGLAALALVAGHVLALFWADKFAAQFAYIGTQFGIASWHELVRIAFVLLPALLVLLVSKKRSSRLPRPIGALMVGILAVALLVPTLSLLVLIEPGSRGVYDILDHYQAPIVTIALVVALIDVMLAGAPKPHNHDKD